MFQEALIQQEDRGVFWILFLFHLPVCRFALNVNHPSNGCLFGWTATNFCWLSFPVRWPFPCHIHQIKPILLIPKYMCRNTLFLVSCFRVNFVTLQVQNSYFFIPLFLGIIGLSISFNVYLAVYISELLHLCFFIFPPCLCFCEFPTKLHTFKSYPHFIPLWLQARVYLIWTSAEQHIHIFMEGDYILFSKNVPKSLKKKSLKCEE